MDNQDQYNPDSEVDTGTTVTEFSTRRRVVTVILVLVAALLLGYILYTMLFLSQSGDQSVVPAQPELSEQEQFMQRLREFEQKPPEPISASTSERLEAFIQRPAVPASQEQVDSLDRFLSGS